MTGAAWIQLAALAISLIVMLVKFARLQGKIEQSIIDSQRQYDKHLDTCDKRFCRLEKKVDALDGVKP